MTRLYAITAGVLIALMLGTAVAWVMLGRTGDQQFAQCSASSVAGGDIGGPFTLVNESGQTVTDADVLTEPSLVYFGYTFCPDICPLDVARNADAVDLLEEAGHEVTPVFISIDPERDTPEVLADYTDNLHPRMIGLTGSAEQVKEASKAYKTFYRKHDGDDPDYYLMDHSTFTYLMLPEHGFVEFFRRDMTAEDMAQATACFVEAS